MKMIYTCILKAPAKTNHLYRLYVLTILLPVNNLKFKLNIKCTIKWKSYKRTV